MPSSTSKDAILAEFSAMGVTFNRRDFASCPWHDEKTPSLHLYRQNHNQWGYHCFGCGTSGSMVDLVMDRLGCDRQQALAHIHGDEYVATLAKRQAVRDAELAAKRKYARMEFEQLLVRLRNAKRRIESLCKNCEEPNPDAVLAADIAYLRACEALAAYWHKDGLRDIVDFLTAVIDHGFDGDEVEYEANLQRPVKFDPDAKRDQHRSQCLEWYEFFQPPPRTVREAVRAIRTGKWPDDGELAEFLVWVVKREESGSAIKPFARDAIWRYRQFIERQFVEEGTEILPE